jgi:hypothetical protein
VIVKAYTGFTRRWRGSPGANPMPGVVHQRSPPVVQLACVMMCCTAAAAAVMMSNPGG